MKHLTRLLTVLSTRFAKGTLLIACLLAVLGVLHAAQNLSFDTNQDHLISEHADYYRNYTDFLKEFGDWEYVYVVIDAGKDAASHAQAKAFSKRLAALLEMRADLFPEVTARIPFDALKNGVLLLAPQADFEQFLGFANEQAGVLARFLAVKDVAGWYSFVSSLFSSPPESLTPNPQPPNCANCVSNRFDRPDKSERLETYWPFLKDALAAPFDQQAVRRLSETNLLTLLSGRHVDSEGFLFSENGELLFLRILPKKDFGRMDILAEPLDYLRAVIADIKPQFPGLDCGVTGRPVLQHDEAISTQVDSKLAGGASFLLVALLVMFAFRQIRRPLFVVFALLMGLCWSVGLVSVLFGQLNLITLVFTIILIGLGIENGIHFLSRYEKERTSGLAPAEAIAASMTYTGRAILIGAVTSAAAFGTAVFTDFLGLQQLGLITAMGLVLCCLAELTVFPSLLLLFDQGTLSMAAAGKQPKSRLAFLRRAAFLSHHPKWVFVVFGLLTVVCLPLALKTRFDSNLLKLQDQNMESVRYEKLISDRTDFSTWFLAHKTRDLAALERVRVALSKLATVKRTESILDLVPQGQGDRIGKIEAVAKKVATDQERTEEQKNRKDDGTENGATGVAIKSLKKAFEDLAAKAFSAGLVDEYEELNNTVTMLGDFETRHGNRPVFGPEFLASIGRAQSLLRDMLSPRIMTEDMLPQALKTLFKSESGYYSLAIYPRQDIWQGDNMQAFITEVRQVIPDVTGAPVTTFESTRRMVTGFILVGLLTSFWLLLLSGLEFKQIKIPLMVYGNLVLSLVWLLAFMWATGISINLANFFALPMLIGTNIDHGLHLFHRHREGVSVDDLYATTIPAVLLCGLTNILGFVSLSFVRHQGLASFGLIMTVGTVFIVLDAVVLIPTLIRKFPTS